MEHGLGRVGPAELRPLTKPLSRAVPSRDGMELENEAGLKRRNPPWPLVERVVRELDEGHGNSFAILSLPGNTYVQTIRGFNGCHLEWRITGASLEDYVHYRAACLGGSAKEIELKKYDAMGDGQHRDLLGPDDVTDAFRAFYRGEEPPAWLEWRELQI